MRSSIYTTAAKPEPEPEPEVGRGGGSRKCERTARVARLSDEGVDVNAYMAGKSSNTSSMLLNDVPAWSRCTPARTSAATACPGAASLPVLAVEVDVYSRARSWRSGSGMEPFRCAWSSALGRRSRKATWVDAKWPP